MNLAVIPIRKGSSLKDKNLTPLNGKPLYLHTLEETLNTRLFDRIVISTDYDIDLFEEHLSDVVKYHIRPEELCTDDATLNEVISYVLNETERFDERTYCNIFTLQVTSPLRKAHHIKEAFERFENMRVDSLISVKEELHSLWSTYKGQIISLYEPKVNRQKAHPFYIGNGAIFITKRWVLENRKERLGGKIELYVMNERDSLDIHTKEDLDLAEFYINRKI
jgi:CMP-N,N'-diacetyllegionaminic acid synthase